MIDVVLDEVQRNLADFDEGGRIFHGRGHSFPGWEDLCIDFFPPVLIVQAFRDGYEVPSWCSRLLEIVAEHSPVETVLLQNRFDRLAMWQVLHGELPRQVYAREKGLRYQLALMRKQNIGFFPDMAEGRALAASLGAGGAVLNLFAYTCSFSVACLAAGATACVNMDISKAALSVGRANHRLNDLDLSQVSFQRMDVLKSFGRMKKLGPYQLIVCDPPSRQGGFDARQDYARVVRRLPEMLVEGGHVMACLNSPHLGPEFLDELFTDEWWHKTHTSGRPAAFVEGDAARTLKIHVYRFEGQA